MIEINGHEFEWRENMNIKDMLKMCNYSFPLIIIRVNEELILKNDYESFIIPDNSKIQVIHLMSGG